MNGCLLTSPADAAVPCASGFSRSVMRSLVRRKADRCSASDSGCQRSACTNHGQLVAACSKAFCGNASHTIKT